MPSPKVGPTGPVSEIPVEFLGQVLSRNMSHIFQQQLVAPMGLKQTSPIPEMFE